MAQFLVGTKRNTFGREVPRAFLETLIVRACLTRSAGHKKAQRAGTRGSAATRTKSTEQPNDITLSFAFLGRDRLCISVQCHSTGGVPKQFLHHLNVRPIRS